MSLLETFDLYPINVGLTHNSKTTFRTKFGGAYTLIVLILAIAYAIVIVIEPLKASTSTTATAAAGTGDSPSLGGISAGTVGSTLPETEIINGIEFQGTYEVKKYTRYIDNFTYSTAETFKPHQGGFQFAFYLPEDIDSNVYFYDMYHVLVENGTYTYNFVETKL